MIRTRSYAILCICLSSFKFLFLKSYVSTDFDVHRNWMAITYHLPLNDWYYNTTSEWTLDYPPLFAVFELFLAFIAQALDLHDALQLSPTPIRSDHVIVYQKITVIAGDCLYYYGVYKLCKSLQNNLLGPVAHSGPQSQDKLKPASSCVSTAQKENKYSDSNVKKKSVQVRVSSSPSRQPPEQNILDSIYKPDSTSCIAVLLLLQPGLLLVDHVHFQYNGLLSGFLLLSIANTIDRNFANASIWFALLINLKHIYLYCAPAVGMYFLVSYCCEKVDNQSRIWTFFTRAGRLGSTVIFIFIIAYAPFSDHETLKQVISRLFPFKRGLTHAYWAPNFWSLYNLADKILATVFKDSLKVTFDLESLTKSRRMIQSTSGRVGEFEHQVLPIVKPLTTFILVGSFVIPIVVKFMFQINRKSPRLFMKGLTLTAFISFMFGWHVHEKAIILILLPMIPISFTDPHLRDAFLRLILAGTYSLYPLIHQPAEYLAKLTLLVAYYNYARSSNPSANQPKSTQKLVEHNQQTTSFLKRSLQECYYFFDNAYIFILILNEIYCSLVFGRFNYGWNLLSMLNKYEFLPLMTTSTLSALGISASFLEIYYDFIFRSCEL